VDFSRAWAVLALDALASGVRAGVVPRGFRVPNWLLLMSAVPIGLALASEVGPFCRRFCMPPCCCLALKSAITDLSAAGLTGLSGLGGAKLVHCLRNSGSLNSPKAAATYPIACSLRANP